jgi:opacity protein-like surface antigen
MAAKEYFMTVTNRRGLAARYMVGALVLAALAATTASSARAIELIPSLGITKSTDTNAADAKAFGGLALRAPLLPFLKAEGAIGYRQDSFAAGDVKVRQWPVSASLWASPLPMIYAGGGIGWYRTTLDYSSALPIKDVTTNKVGVHVGGGAGIPIGPRLGLDLNGRYIFMQKDKNNVQVPTTFNPDYWNLALGLAIKF